MKALAAAHASEPAALCELWAMAAGYLIASDRPEARRLHEKLAKALAAVQEAGPADGDAACFLWVTNDGSPARVGLLVIPNRT